MSKLIAASDGAVGIRLLRLDNPPVNALGFALSAELLSEIDAAEADPAVRVVVIAGSNGLFSGGADITEFRSEPPPDAKTIRDVIARIERGSKVYVAAIDGNALGGGFELALACDYRAGTARARLGLPEIKLGLIPGAGGTQRLPRLIGAQAALEAMLKGENIPAARAKELGILDVVVDDPVAAAAAYADASKRRVSALRAELGVRGLNLFAVPFVVAQAHKMCPPEDRGGFAAHKLVDAVQAAIEFDFPRGIAREERLFEELIRSAPAQALMHVFFAERELGKIPGLAPVEPMEIKTAGIVGGGTMGTGIAIAFASAGFPVTVVEPQDAAIERAKQLVFGTFSYQVQRGRMTQEEAWQRAQSIAFENDFAALKECDIVVEAVFENMDVKKEVFAKLDAVVKPDAILATNTSTLDVDALAAQTSRPQNVAGTHFFAPANIMRLLEVVRGKESSPQTIATAMRLARTLRKVGVLSGNAFGFIGNRMVFDYGREAVYLAEEGIPPYRIDAAMRDFGMAMGPFAMFDLSGVDVFWHIQQARAGTVGSRTKIVDRLYEAKRWGQKSGKGFYLYEKGGREPIRDPEVEQMFAEEAKTAGIAPQESTEAEIVKRLVWALVNAGAELLRTGIALRPGDIDIVYVYGYGFPPHHGGPMWYAGEVGLPQVLDDIRRFGWEPSPLLVELASQGATFEAFGDAAKELSHA